jgi:hypothetical protein
VSGSIQKADHALSFCGVLMRAVTTMGDESLPLPDQRNECLPAVTSLAEVKLRVLLGDLALRQVAFLSARASMTSMPSPGLPGLATTRALSGESV